MMGLEQLKAFNQLMQACAKLAEGADEQRLSAIQSELTMIRAVLKDAAPEPWEVAGQLSHICQAEGEAWCITPKGFVLGEGLLMEAKGEAITLDGIQVTIEAVRDAIAALQDAHALPPVQYFGPLERSGHHLYAPDGRKIHSINDNLGLTLERGIDQGYTPYADRHHPQVEGHAKLSHENGMTVLGIWDRSVDTRQGSHSTYIAVGTYDFPTMCKLCQTAFPKRWALLANRVEIKLVATGKR